MALVVDCTRAGVLLCALSVVSRMARTSGLMPDVMSYSTFLSCCGKAKDPDGAFEIVRRCAAAAAECRQLFRFRFTGESFIGIILSRKRALVRAILPCYWLQLVLLCCLCTLSRGAA